MAQNLAKLDVNVMHYSEYYLTCFCHSGIKTSSIRLAWPWALANNQGNVCESRSPFADKERFSTLSVHHKRLSLLVSLPELERGLEVSI